MQFWLKYVLHHQFWSNFHEGSREEDFFEVTTEPNDFNKVHEYQLFENVGLETALFEDEKSVASIKTKKKTLELLIVIHLKNCKPSPKVVKSVRG